MRPRNSLRRCCVISTLGSMPAGKCDLLRQGRSEEGGTGISAVFSPERHEQLQLDHPPSWQRRIQSFPTASGCVSTGPCSAKAYTTYAQDIKICARYAQDMQICAGDAVQGACSKYFQVLSWLFPKYCLLGVAANIA